MPTNNAEQQHIQLKSDLFLESLDRSIAIAEAEHSVNRQIIQKAYRQLEQNLSRTLHLVDAALQADHSANDDQLEQASQQLERNLDQALYLVDAEQQAHKLVNNDALNTASTSLLTSLDHVLELTDSYVTAKDLLSTYCPQEQLLHNKLVNYLSGIVQSVGVGLASQTVLAQLSGAVQSVKNAKDQATMMSSVNSLLFSQARHETTEDTTPSQPIKVH